MGKSNMLDDYTRDFAQLRENAEKVPNVKTILNILTHVQTVTAPISNLNSNSSVSPRFGSIYYASTTKAM